MKGEVASVLIVAALIIGAVVGTFGIAGFAHTVTVIETPTSVIQSEGQQFCLVTTYRVFSVESIHNSTTVGGTSTQDSIVASFTTSGYPSSTTIYPTTTQTFSRAWNDTNCYLIP